MEEHLSGEVGLGWAVTLGQFDLAELRQLTETTFECVEQQTGTDFGELFYDRFGYLTEEGRQAKNTASEHQDHVQWTACENELGYLAESQAETQELVACVELSAGIDFGEVTYDKSGRLTEAGQLTVRAASNYQSDVPWVACQQELRIVLGD